MQLRHVNDRLPKIDAMGAHLVGLLNNARCMQQCLGRNTTYIQTDAAESRVTLNQDHFKAKIGGAKGCGVTARARTQHHKIYISTIVFYDRWRVLQSGCFRGRCCFCGIGWRGRKRCGFVD